MRSTIIKAAALALISVMTSTGDAEAFYVEKQTSCVALQDSCDYYYGRSIYSTRHGYYGRRW